MGRQASSRTFFEVIGIFQAKRLLSDAQAQMNVAAAITMDAVGGVAEAMSAMFEGITGLIDEQMEAFFKYEEELIRVKKFYQGATEEVTLFANESLRLGETFAFSGAEALKAAAQMAQMKTVLGEAQAVIAGTEMGLLFAEIGGMETDLAMKRLTSLMQQTHFAMGGLTSENFKLMDAEMQANIVRGNTMRVLDQLNTIENSSVATMEDMTFVLNQFASQADLAGESMGDMASLAALLLEAGEETSRAGTGLRMMFSRIAVDGGDAAQAIAEAIPGLDAQTVSTMSLTQIIRALVPHYEQMTDIERIRLTQAIAGNRHYVKLQKLIQNHSRLIELQGMAYKGTFGAVEEFENRQASALFQFEKMQAKIENLRIEIGENLADAYVRALAPQELFLRSMRGFSETAFGGNLLANIMLFNNTLETFTVPATFITGFGSLLISLQTLRVVLKQLSGVQVASTSSYAMSARMAEYRNMVSLQSTSLLGVEKTAVERLLVSQEARSRATLSHISRRQMLNLVNMDSIRIEIEMNKEELRAGGLSKERQGQLRKRNKEMVRKIKLHEENLVLADEEYRVALRNHNIDKRVRMEAQANANAVSAYMARSSDLRLQEADTLRTYNNQLRRENRLMQDKFALSVPLTKEVYKELTARAAAINTKIAEAQVTASLLRIQHAELVALDSLTAEQEELKISLSKRIAAHEKEIGVLGRSRQEIMMLQKASDLASERTEEFTLKMQQNTMELLKNAYSGKNLTKQIGRMRSTMQGTVFIFSMFADTTQEMVAGMAAGVVGFAAMRGAAALYEKGIDTALIKTTLLTGGINLLVGAGVGALAYFGSKKLFEGLGIFEETKDEIAGLNDELARTIGLMDEMSNKGDHMVSALLGDVTYNDLRDNAELAGDSLETIGAKIGELEAAKTAGVLTTAQENALQYQIDLHQKAYNEIALIDEAHHIRIANQTTQGMQTTGEILQAAYAGIYDDISGEEALGDGLIKLFTPKMYEDFTYTYQDPYSTMEPISITLSAEDAKDMGFGNISTMDMYGNAMTSSYATSRGRKEAAVDYIMKKLVDPNREAAEEIADMWLKSSQAQMTYSDNILQKVTENNNAMASDTMEATGNIVEEFSNMREELFFGEQTNFQGALFKEIKNNGVENLLYKTEIMQTNNFNGITIDEAVERVGEGIFNQLRDMGILTE